MQQTGESTVVDVERGTRRMRLANPSRQHQPPHRFSAAPCVITHRRLRYPACHPGYGGKTRIPVEPLIVIDFFRI